MRIAFLILTLLTAFSLKSYSQQANDSFQVGLNIASGIEKVDLLNERADAGKLDNTEVAKTLAQQAFVLADSLDYDRGKGYAMQNLGFIAYLDGDFETALEKNQQALLIGEKLNDLKLKKNACEVLALVSEENNAFDESLRYFQYSYELNSMLDNPVGMGLDLLGAGRIYEKMTRYRVALQSNRQSLDIFIQLGNDIGEAKAYLVIAKNYYYLDNPDSSSWFFNQAGEIIQRQNSQELLLDMYLEKVEIYSTSFIDSALYYVAKATDLAVRLNRLYLQSDLLLQTSELYSKRGEYRLAYDFHQKYKHFNDSLSNIQQGMYPGPLNLSVNDAIYSEQQIGSNRLKGFDYRGSRSARWLVIGFGALIVCISGLWIWLGYKYKLQTKSIKKLDSMQKEIDTLSAEIVQKEKLIINLRGNKKNRKKDEKESLIIKGVEDPNVSESEEDNIENDLQERVMRSFVTAEWKKLENARKELQIDNENINLKEIQTEDWGHINLNALTLAILRLNHKDVEERIRIHHNPDPAINLYCHNASILLLINCLLQNAIEAIEKEGDIFIDYFSDTDKITYRIIDTGNGIASSDMKNIFMPFFSTKKSDRHVGLGLSICKKIVEIHQAVIKVKSKPGKVTEMTLEFYYS